MPKRKTLAPVIMLDSKSIDTFVVPDLVERNEMIKFLRNNQSTLINELRRLLPIGFPDMWLSAVRYGCEQLPEFWTCDLAISKIRAWMGKQSTAQRGMRRADEKQILENHKRQATIDIQCMTHTGWVLVQMNAVNRYAADRYTDIDNFQEDVNVKTAKWLWLQLSEAYPYLANYQECCVILKCNDTYSYTTVRHPLVDSINHLTSSYTYKQYTCMSHAHTEKLFSPQDENVSVVHRQLNASTLVHLNYLNLPRIGEWTGYLEDSVGKLNMHIRHTCFSIDSTALHQLDSWMHLYPPRNQIDSDIVKRRRTDSTEQWIVSFPYDIWVLIGLYFAAPPCLNLIS